MASSRGSVGPSLMPRPSLLPLAFAGRVGTRLCGTNDGEAPATLLHFGLYVAT